MCAPLLTEEPQYLRRALAAMVVVMAVAAWMYWPTLAHGVVWDDFPYLVDSSRYWFWQRIPELFFEPFGLSHAYFRPLALATFTVYPVTADGGTTIHHAINVALHSANTGLLFLLLLGTPRHHATGAGQPQHRRLLWAVVASLAFAAHPVMIEGVAWLSGRFDLLMTLFLLVAMLIDQRMPSATARAVLIGGSTLLALLCKESVLGWVVALPLLHIAASRAWAQNVITAGRMALRTHRWTYLGVAIAVLTYFALRVNALGALKPAVLGTWQGEPLDRVIVALITVWKYAGMTLFPWSFAGPLQPFDFTSARTGMHLVIAALGVSLVTAAIVAVFWPRARRLLPLTVWLASLWPVLNLVSFPNGETIVADRYLMLPIALALYTVFLLADAYVGLEKGAPKRAMLAIGALATAAWLAASIAVVRVTAPLWRDNFSFWSFVLQRHPESATALGNLGREYLLRGDLPQAETHLARSFQKIPNLANSVNLAFVLALQGDTASARGQLASIPENVVAGATPNERAMLENTLGWIEASAGDRSAARQHFHKALEQDPTLWKARLNLADVLASDGAREEAERELALLPSTLTDDGQKRLIAIRASLASNQGANRSMR